MVDVPAVSATIHSATRAMANWARGDDQEGSVHAQLHDQVVDQASVANAQRGARIDGPLERLLAQPSVLDRFEDPGTKPPQIR